MARTTLRACLRSHPRPRPAGRLFKHALIISVLAFVAQAQVMITELHRDPAGGENESPGGASHEFVEIMNFGADTVSLDSLFLTDGVESDAVIPWHTPLALHADCSTGDKLAPGRTALILDSNYAAAVKKSASGRFPIKAGTLLFTTQDADLGNGLANDDGVAIYKGTKTLVDTVLCIAADDSWTATTPSGGKIVFTKPGNVPEGRSVVPVSFLFSAPDFATCADSLTPGAFERLNNAWFAEWRLGGLDSARRTYACTLACIRAGATVQEPLRYAVVVRSSFKTVTAAQGTCVVRGNRGDAVCTVPLDSAPHFLHLDEPDGETRWPFDVSHVWTPAFSVRINELFPRATPGEPEWFELVNVSPMPIDLGNWLFGTSEDTATLTRDDKLLQPGGFVVVTANGPLFSARYPAKNNIVVPPRWHALDNFADTLCIWDAKRAAKELVRYRGDWFIQWNNQSIERVSDTSPGTDRASWTLASSPTPGRPNGAIFWQAASRPGLDIGPLPFTPNGDGRDDLLAIAISLPAEYSAQIAIYGFSGKKLRDLSGQTGPKLAWDGKQDNGMAAPPGPFFVVMTARSPAKSETVRKKGVLWR